MFDMWQTSAVLEFSGISMRRAGRDSSLDAPEVSKPAKTLSSDSGSAAFVALTAASILVFILLVVIVNWLKSPTTRLRSSPSVALRPSRTNASRMASPFLMESMEMFFTVPISHVVLPMNSSDFTASKRAVKTFIISPRSGPPGCAAFPAFSGPPVRFPRALSSIPGRSPSTPTAGMDTSCLSGSAFSSESRLSALRTSALTTWFPCNNAEKSLDAMPATVAARQAPESSSKRNMSDVM
mmetsp:Transcript_95806/g.254424  ORF Transcript_95806/g.254424 Transcript_95806/m.254424 type:complete len:239 (+) Transcript_95806:389-1105(+)